MTANTWAISARGFNDRFSDELLVLLDGRSVYTPTFGGVFWDVLDVPLEDIERIEVIRGPGGSVWGSNAVNGVINIITKKAEETRGGLVAGETLSRERSRQERDGGCFGLIMADLDHFKKVNDTYGHLAGDAVLKEAARRMKSDVRPYDTVGRYGGEEFLIVVPSSDVRGTRACGGRTRSPEPGSQSH